MNYDDLATHRLMVRDEARTDAFRRAIAGAVKAGSVVLDLGAGSGILSLFAAQAGAARVYAVERAPATAAAAAALAGANGFGQVVQVLNADIRAITLPEPVDVIISEWMGTLGIDENMYGSLLWARHHLLKPGGVVIPARVTAMAAPVTTAQRADAGFFAGRPWGLDLGLLAEPVVNELLMVRRRIRPEDVAAPPAPLWTHVALEDGAERVRHAEEGTLVFTAGADASATALALWFQADLADGVSLANGPSDPDTHWGQMLLPFDTPLALTPGDRLSVRVTAWPVGPGPLMFRWSWQLNDGPEATRDTLGAGTGDAEATMAPPPRSALSRFLARLAADPEQLAAFLRNPDTVMDEHRLSEEHRAALLSRDQDRIGMALYETGHSA